MDAGKVKPRSVWATPRQWAEIEERAKREGMSIAQYMIACVDAPDEPSERHDRAQRLTGAEQREIYDLVRIIARDHDKQFNGLRATMRQGDDTSTERDVSLSDVVKSIHRMVEALDG